MGFVVLICLALFVMFIASLIMPWVLRSRINELEQQLLQLAAQFRTFKAQGLQTPPVQPAPVEQRPYFHEPVQTATPPRPTYTAPVETIFTPSPRPNDVPEFITFSPTHFPKHQTSDQSIKQDSGFEWQFGLRLPVWIGGIALALAGFYLVKYSIEMGLLSPLIRLILGTLFGGGLIASAHVMRTYSNRTDTTRITQSLSGAGIAVLYACAFAASSLYHLIEPFTAFAAMATITFGAVILSLEYGPPIAVLGMLGGFLTPALVGASETNTPLLFIYLYAILTGLLVVIRRNNWWALSCLLIMGAYLWVAAWLILFYDASDALWVGLFVLGVTLNSILATRTIRHTTTTIDTSHPLTQFNYLTVAGALILLGSIITKTDFSFMEFGLFGLLSASSLYLAYQDSLHFRFAPYLSLAANAVLLTLWHTYSETHIVTICTLFGLLYGVAGYALLQSDRDRVTGAIISGAGAVLFFFMAYTKLHGWNLDYDFTSNSSWAMIAFGLVAAYVALTRHNLYTSSQEDHIHQSVLAALASTATAFLSLGLVIGVGESYLPLALSLEIVLLSWLTTQVRVNALYTLTAAVGVVFTLILVPQFILLVQLMVASLFGGIIGSQSVPLVDSPILHLGLPALLFALASVLLRAKKDGTLVALFETMAIALAALSVYYLTRGLLNPGSNILIAKADFGQRGIMTNLFFAGSLICAWARVRWDRSVLKNASLLFVGMAVFRIVYFDLVFDNPLWSHSRIAGMTLFNMLSVTYGLPILWLAALRPFFTDRGFITTSNGSGGFMLALLFTWITLNVRFAFQGAYLDGVTTGTAEIYTYSIAWLLLGIGLLIAGTATHNKTIRRVSLCVMILTIGKVFLYDASALTGLLRVFSFLGLGLTLLALSWFYTRFVFQSHHSDTSQV